MTQSYKFADKTEFKDNEFLSTLDPNFDETAETLADDSKIPMLAYLWLECDKADTTEVPTAERLLQGNDTNPTSETCVPG